MILQSCTLRVHLRWGASRSEAFAEIWWLLQTCVKAGEPLIVMYGTHEITVRSTMSSLDVWNAVQVVGA